MKKMQLEVKILDINKDYFMFERYNNKEKVLITINRTNEEKDFYIPREYQEKPWLHVCDCSKLLAEIIYNIHNDKSISSILRDKSYPVKLLEKKFQTQEKK